MARFSIRDVLWLTVVAAVAVAWWLDRDQLAGPAADYHRLKTDYDRLKSEEVVFNKQVEQAIQQALAEQATVERRRPVPGDDNYRFPPEYPLHYGPSRSP